MAAYYNEFDKYAAQWLRNLIQAGHIAPGDVDDRSIEDVRPNDLRGYDQCHFFAGIGIWSYALRLAGWPDDRPVWTGSCPCQPFSTAGKGAGFSDERHLWPAFHHLIKERKPAKVYGEQVASKDADTWIDLVHTDMEAMDYAFGAIPFPSASVGAPHIRDRTYWVADSDDARLEGRRTMRKRTFELVAGSRGVAGGMGNANGARWQPRESAAASAGYGSSTIADGGTSRLGHTNLPKHDSGPPGGQQQIYDEDRTTRESDGTGPTNGFWRHADWVGCTDGFWRPIEPGTFPLANGIVNRMGKLRAYGNAINAQQAAEFIKATSN